MHGSLCCPGGKICPGHLGLLLAPRDALQPHPPPPAAAPSALAPAVRLLGPAHGSYGALQAAVSPLQARGQAQARWDGLCLLHPFCRFRVCSVQEEVTWLTCPCSKSVAVSPPLNQLDRKLSLPTGPGPAPVGPTGALRRGRAGQPERWGAFRSQSCRCSPVWRCPWLPSAR